MTDQDLFRLEAQSIVVSAIGVALRLDTEDYVQDICARKLSIKDILSPIELKSLQWELSVVLSKEEAEDLVETAHLTMPNLYKAASFAAAEFKKAKLKFRHVIDHASRHMLFDFDNPAFVNKMVDFSCLSAYLYPNLIAFEPSGTLNYLPSLTKSGRERLKANNNCQKIEGCPIPDTIWAKGNCSFNSKIFLIQALCKAGLKQAATQLACKAMVGPLRDLLDYLIVTDGRWSKQAENLRLWSIFRSYPYVFANNWDTNGAWEEVFFSSQTVLLREDVCNACKNVQPNFSGPPHLSPEEAIVLMSGGEAEMDPIKTCTSCAAQGQIKLRLCVTEAILCVDFSHPGCSMGLPTLAEATEKGVLRTNFWLNQKEYIMFAAIMDEIDDSEEYVRDGWPDDQNCSQFDEAKSVSLLKYNIENPPLTSGNEEETERSYEDNQPVPVSSHNFVILKKDGSLRRICDGSATTSFDEIRFVEQRGMRYTVQYLYYVPKASISTIKDEESKMKVTNPAGPDKKRKTKENDSREQSSGSRTTRSMTKSIKTSTSSSHSKDNSSCWEHEKVELMQPVLADSTDNENQRLSLLPNCYQTALQIKAPKKPTWHNWRMEQVEKMKYEQPPNDFREISIYPTFEDVVNPQRPFLRPNVINGPYFDVEHYLDTQYRLLREDFVRPLREGVQDILKGTDSKKCESLSVRVYNEVQFIKYVREIEGSRVLNEGTLLCFDTSTNSRRFERTNWEQTKKFMHGALLCFTRNCFQTLLFATVSSRDVKFLRQKQILVTFCEEYDENIYDKNAKYTMIESEVFFDPYNQVLGTLKNLNDRNFPFPKYFIDVQKDDAPPAYLLDAGPVQIKVKGTSGSYRLTILKEATWPSSNQLGLDNSQYSALKAALTKEFAVIQGPPGNGKTFMALKIAEILIQNKEAMNRETPILVVCLTNHALDQFLVGMLIFTKSLVRIGGQSRCEELDEYNIKKMRLPRSQKQYDIGDALSKAYLKLAKLDKEIADFNVAIELRKGFVIPTNKTRAIPSVLNSSTARDLLLDEFSGSLRYVSFKEIRERVWHWIDGNLRDIETNEAYKDFSGVEKQFYLQLIREKGQYFTDEIDFLEFSAAEVEVVGLHRGKELAENWRQWNNMIMVDLLELHYFELQNELLKHKRKREMLVDEITEKSKMLEELRSIENVNELRTKDVIGLTTNGAARLHSMLNALGCEIAIIEEAAEVMEPHIVSCLSKSCKHLILIGDHKQLHPKISEYELGKFYNFDVSLFERMVINREGCITLQVQHRMAPEMAKLIVPTIYKTLENHQSVFERPKLKSLTQRLSFVTHSEPEHQDNENSSRTNPHEASYLISLCQHLLKQGYAANQITILATYKGQMFLIKRMIKSIKTDSSKEKGLIDVRVSLVDDFQGEENDIILLSLVRSNAEGRIGFLATENRVCVALSRAKQGFVMIGNMEILSEKSQIWTDARRSIEKQFALHHFLTIRCEVRPDKKFKVSSPKDFQMLAPYGGCNQICEDQLSCGHPCKTVCHLMQIEHAKIKCNESCEKKCDAGLHSCKQKCFVKCGSSCIEMVQKNLPCGHQAMLRCHADEEHFSCTEIVTKKFPECNHEAEVACSCKRCPQPCDMQAPCGHSCTRKCHTDSDPDHLQYNCTKSCIKMNKDCRSNHPCNKKCREECGVCEIQVKVKRSCGHQFDLKCYIDTEGIECRNMCAKMLDCGGHRCLKKCTTECSPCIQLLEKVISECGHSARRCLAVEKQPRKIVQSSGSSARSFLLADTLAKPQVPLWMHYQVPGGCGIAASWRVWTQNQMALFGKNQWFEG